MVAYDTINNSTIIDISLYPNWPIFPIKSAALGVGGYKDGRFLIRGHAKEGQYVLSIVFRVKYLLPF